MLTIEVPSLTRDVRSARIASGPNGSRPHASVTNTGSTPTSSAAWTYAWVRRRSSSPLARSTVIESRRAITLSRVRVRSSNSHSPLSLRLRLRRRTPPEPPPDLAMHQLAVLRVHVPDRRQHREHNDDCDDRQQDLVNVALSD